MHATEKWPEIESAVWLVISHSKIGHVAPGSAASDDQKPRTEPGSGVLGAGALGAGALGAGALGAGAFGAGPFDAGVPESVPLGDSGEFNLLSNPQAPARTARAGTTAASRRFMIERSWGRPLAGRKPR
jgi:hypothetical protein